MTRRRWPGTALVGWVLVLALAGCGGGRGGQEGVVEADCAEQVRLDGVVYTAHSYTTRPGTAHRRAERSDCDDVGPDPQGSVFGDSPDRVETVRFPGFAPERVLGVRFRGSSYTVFVADSLAEAERERIRVALEQAEPGS